MSAKPVYLNNVAQLPSLAPPATATWQPVDHQTVGRLVESAIGQRADIVDAYHCLDRNGSRYFGNWQLRLSESSNLSVGVRNSHGKDMALGLAYGQSVLVCSNGVFLGDTTVTRKHTSGILASLSTILAGFVDSLGQRGQEIIERENRFRETPIGNFLADHLFMESYRAGILPVSKIAHAYREWTTPSHPEHGRGSLWTLEQAVTETLKDYAPAIQQQRSQQWAQIADQYALAS